MELGPVDSKREGVSKATWWNAEGHPVPGARVAIGVAPAYLPLGSTPAGSAMTDLAGHFRLGPGIAPGTVDLTAVGAAAGRGSARGVHVEGGRTTERVRIRLEPGPEPEESSATGNVALTLSERTGSQIAVGAGPRGQ